MPNILTRTEEFNHADWFKSNVTVTANTHNPPAVYGANATQADTLADTATAADAFANQSKTKVTNDTDNWIGSVFIRKDSDQSRFPEVAIQFATGGTTLTRGVRINTSTGAIAAGVSGAPAASACVDFDSNWWRVWLRHPDNATGNTVVRLYIFPARSDVLTPATNVQSLTASIVAWGANLERVDTLQEYQPDPFYDFPPPEGEWFTIATLGSAASSYSDTVGLTGGVEYDYRILATNVAGDTPSNTVTAIPNPDSGGAASTLTLHRRIHAGVHRATGRGVN